MKLIYLCIPPHHSCDLLCMATLFVWYNGKVLHTWHYNWLVTHAGVCFLNNNPPPARALRNVITINLNRADQSWGGGSTSDAIPNDTQMRSTQSVDDTVWQVASMSEVLIDQWSPSMLSCHRASGSGPVYVGLNQVRGRWWRLMVTIMWLNLTG